MDEINFVKNSLTYSAEDITI